MRYLSDLFHRNRKWAAARKNEDPKFFERLCGIQKPGYLWIGCSDSRVPANVIVGLDPGELFVHRNVANVVSHADANLISVLQYAVDTLQVRHVIVCGHYGCGGVTLALQEEPGPEPLATWIAPIRRLSTEHREELQVLPDEESRINRLCELNVMGQVRAVCRTNVVSAALSRGQELAVHGWIYDLRDGLLRDLNVTVP